MTLALLYKFPDLTFTRKRNRTRMGEAGGSRERRDRAGEAREAGGSGGRRDRAGEAGWSSSGTVAAVGSGSHSIRKQMELILKTTRIQNVESGR